MSYGFVATNDWGDHQVDGNYRNLAFLRGGVAPSNGLVVVNPGELLAIRPAGVSDNVAFHWAELNVYTLPAGCYYYIFGFRSPVANFGIRVFDSSGATTYDSGWKLFNLRATLSAPTPQAGSPTLPPTAVSSITLPPGRVYAVIPISLYWRHIFIHIHWNNGPAFWDRKIIINATHSIRINGGNISCYFDRVSNYEFADAPTTGVDYEAETDNATSTLYGIIDVTGYL